MKKKSIVIVTVFLAFSFTAFGQKAFKANDNTINVGAGFLGISWKGVNYSANYEHGFNDRWGAGLHFGYSQYKKNSYTYTAVLVGVRGNYHFFTTEKTDPYIGAELGYASISHTGHNSSVSAHDYSPVGIGFYGGIRQYLTPAVGIYGELHLSTFSIIAAGFTFKF